MLDSVVPQIECNTDPNVLMTFTPGQARLALSEHEHGGLTPCPARPILMGRARADVTR
jgi:hypothetical protein